MFPAGLELLNTNIKDKGLIVPRCIIGTSYYAVCTYQNQGTLAYLIIGYS